MTGADLFDDIRAQAPWARPGAAGYEAEFQEAEALATVMRGESWRLRCSISKLKAVQALGFRFGVLEDVLSSPAGGSPDLRRLEHALGRAEAYGPIRCRARIGAGMFWEVARRKLPRP